jgi:hypothetical protein
MVTRREKISKQLSLLKESVFYKLLEVIESDHHFGKREMANIVKAHRLNNNVYDDHELILSLANSVDEQTKVQCSQEEQLPGRVRIKLESHRNRKDSKEDLNVANETNLKELSNIVTEAGDNAMALTTVMDNTNLNVKTPNKLSLKRMISKTVSTKDKLLANQKNKKKEHIFRKSQLIVPQSIKDKVHNAFRLSREKRSLTNGLCHHAQTKIYRYFSNQKENHLIVSSHHTPNSSHLNLPVFNGKTLKSDTRQTRSVKHKIGSDMESDANDSLYEAVDGEVSIRSSRDTTPDRSLDASSPRKRCLSVSRLAAERLLHKHYDKRPRLDSESGQDADSESDIYSPMEGRQLRSLRRHSHRIDPQDEDSSHSNVSIPNRRSKTAEDWVATFIS